MVCLLFVYIALWADHTTVVGIRHNVISRHDTIYCAVLVVASDFHHCNLRKWRARTHVRMLFIEYSSVFNTVVPQKLCNRLISLRLRSSLCSWVLNFLTDRPKTVRIGNQTLGRRIISTACPQRCVLSPLLYTLFIYYCLATVWWRQRWQVSWPGVRKTISLRTQTKPRKFLLTQGIRRCSRSPVTLERLGSKE